MTTLLHCDIKNGRKRRFMDDEEMDDGMIMGHRQSDDDARLRASEMKRQKTSMQKRMENQTLLANFDKSKLIEIIYSMLEAHPELQETLIKYIPVPTIESARSLLQDMEKRLVDSFPFNRDGPTRDDYTYSRVRKTLQELIDTVIQFCHHFTSSSIHPNITFTFLDLAIHLAQRLPVWDNDENNASRRELFAELSNYWKDAIKITTSKIQSGEVFSPQMLAEWAKIFAQHNAHVGDLFNTSLHQPSASCAPTPDVPICHHPILETDMIRLASQRAPIVGYAGAQI